MYRLLVSLIFVTLLAGCANLQDQGLFGSSSEFFHRTGQALGKIGQPNPVVDANAELKALFEQPYIDPLTAYIRDVEGDSSKADLLAVVIEERERRCDVIASRYAGEPASAERLVLYRAGYNMSCPADVAAYAGRVASLKEDDASAEPAMEVAEPANPEPVVAEPVAESHAIDDALRKQLNDCYLLTAIRNFSSALSACREPADAGNVRAQTNMALIFSALRDYDNAYRWATLAAPESGDAANLLGELYSRGQGVEVDQEKSIQWFEKAASLGHAGAKARLNDVVTASSDASIH
ncbi:tetratricopeptide repeat protein [Marinobacter sp. 1Y8]